MAKTTHPRLDLMDDIHTDYLLIATGIGAALIALIYLVLA